MPPLRPRLRWPTALALATLLLAAAELRADAPASPAPSSQPDPVAAAPAPWDLQRCLRAALEHSPEIVQQRQVVRGAAAREGEARSHLLPRVTWQSQLFGLSRLYDPVVIRSGSYGEIFVPSTSGGGYITSLPPRDVELVEPGPTEYATTRLRLEQPLFTWGRILLGMQLADLNHRLEQSKLRATRFETAYLVRQLYLGLLMGEASLELLASMRGEMQKILADTRAMEAQGLVTPAAALEAEANLRQIEREQARTAAQLVRARESMRLLVGVDPDAPLVLTGRLVELPEPPAPDVEAMLDQAQSRRPELESTALQLQLARKQVRLREAEDLGRPTLGLAAESGLRGDRLPLVRTNWTMAWDHYWMAGLVLEVPLFDGLEAHSKVEQAEAQRSQAELGVEQTRRLVLMEVRQRAAEVEAQRSERVHARARERELAEKHRVAERGFEAGATDRSSYLTRHLEWSEARSRELLSLYLLHAAQLELEHAAGLLPRSVDEVGP